MQRSDFSEMYCSIAQSLGVVGEWWSLLIIRDIALQQNKFTALQKGLGISKKVLADRLATLEEHGVIEKQAISERKTEYSLTEKGRELMPVLHALMAWGDKWLFEGDAPVQLFHKSCEHAFTAEVICNHCKEPIKPNTVKGIPNEKMPDEQKQRWPV
jgi:DNA-binding HxlR family transcriptional regulator